MQSFDQFLAVLSEVPDPRRAEGKIYKLPYVLLFAILAVVTGGNSFRSIETFIKVHRRRLNAAFGLRWQRAPAHTAIRYILQFPHVSPMFWQEDKDVMPVCIRSTTGTRGGSSAHDLCSDLVTLF